MARQVLPIVGAIVGGMIGGPMGASIGMSLGSLAGNAIDPQVLEGPKIGETPMQTSAEGVTRPIVYGTGPVMGNVIAQGDKVIKEVEEEQGKGGPVIVTERLYQTFAVRICEGPIASVTRIWEDEKLVFDIRPESAIQAESAEFSKRLRVYLGTEDQLPDPNLEVKYGAGNTPAYRGTAYAVFQNADLTDRRGSFPNYRWEVASTASVDLGSTMFLLATRGAPLPGENRTLLSSQYGTDWSGVPPPPGIVPNGVERLLASEDRVIAWGPGTNVYTTFDSGQTWPVSATIGGGFGGQRGWYHDGTFYIPRGLNGIYRSIDQGESFQFITGCPVSETLFHNDNFGLSLHPSNGVFALTGNGWSSWTTIPNPFPGTGAMTGINRFATDGQMVMLTGKRTETGLSVVFTSNGSSYNANTPPFVSASDITAAAYGNGIWMVGADNGEVFYLAEGEALWQPSANAPTTSVRDICWNGAVFVVAADAGGPTEDGVVKYTTDGVSLTNAPLHEGLDFFMMAAYPFDTGQAVGAPIPVNQIVADVHQRCGHDVTQFDVSELTDMVDGIVLAGDYTGASAIRSLMPVYFFDGPEYDKKVRYHKRGKPVVATLTLGDLVDDPEEATRENAIEFPKKVNLAYQNPVVGYAPAKATTTRSSPDVRVVGERNVQVPVCMTTDPAAQVSDKLMKVMWAEADGEVKLTVSDKEMSLIPSDCIGLALRGSVRRLRIEKIEMDPGTLKLTCRNDRQSAYTSNVTGVPVPAPTPPPPSIAGATVFEFLDIPALIDTNDTLNYYVAATGVNPAWYGALVQRSLNAGATFTDASVFSRGTVMGVLVDAIPDASEHYTDTTNIVRVQLYDERSLDSITQDEFLSEGGAFALEKPDGTWEIMQYRDADDEGDDVFALSPILRGRLNSGTSSHASGARFVLLSGVNLVPAQSSWLGVDLTHRAVSFNTSPEAAVEYVDEYTGKSQTEWPVADLLLERTGDSVLSTAVPRHRFGTEDAPVRSVNWSGYRWTASDGSNSTSRTTVTDETTFDVTGWATPITITVAQLNRWTGPGSTVSEQIA